MKTGTKIFLGVLLLGAAGGIGYILYKNKKDESIENLTDLGTGNSAAVIDEKVTVKARAGTPVVAVSDSNPPVSNIAIGKHAYAKRDGLKVIKTKDGSVYKTAKKGDWIGVIKAVSGNPQKAFLDPGDRWTILDGLNF